MRPKQKPHASLTWVQHCTGGKVHISEDPNTQCHMQLVSLANVCNRAFVTSWTRVYQLSVKCSGALSQQVYRWFITAQSARSGLVFLSPKSNRTITWPTLNLLHLACVKQQSYNFSQKDAANLQLYVLINCNIVVLCHVARKTQGMKHGDCFLVKYTQQ